MLYAMLVRWYCCRDVSADAGSATCVIKIGTPLDGFLYPFFFCLSSCCYGADVGSFRAVRTHAIYIEHSQHFLFFFFLLPRLTFPLD